MLAQGFDLSIIQLHVLEVCLELHRRGLRSKTKLAASPDTEESEIVVEQIESLVKICENMWTLWTDYLMLAVWTPFSRNIWVKLQMHFCYIYILYTFRNHEILLKWTCFSCPTSKTSSVIYRGMWFSFTHSLNMSMYTTRKQPHHLLLGEVPFCCGYINVNFWWSKHVFIDDQMIAHVFVVNSSSLLFQSFFAGGKTSFVGGKTFVVASIFL